MPVVRKWISYPVDSDFFKHSKHVQELVKRKLKFNIFELKSLFISCKFYFAMFYFAILLLKKSLSGGQRYRPFVQPAPVFHR